MTRNAFIVYVDEDPTGGPFGTPEMTRISLQGILMDRVPHYHPNVEEATPPASSPIVLPRATPTISEGTEEA